MRAILKKHIVNARGGRLSQKLVVFESDDWGAIRIPSVKIREELLQKNLIRKNDPFSYYDSLETAEDYEALFRVLRMFKDSNGQSPKITANFILNNPDFHQIAAHNFESYFNEDFRNTYKRYPNSENAWDSLKGGIKEELIVPQFHGREHLNVVRWMELLQAGEERFRYAFKRECFAIDDLQGSNRRQNLMAAYDYNNVEELNFVKQSIKKGLAQFHEIFGYKSLTNVSPCYVWDDQVENELLLGGVKLFQGSFLQNIPIPGNSFKKNYRYSGQRNKDHQFHIVRNCLFEPALSVHADWVSKCMESIDIAFKWRKPAIIGTHRLNFSGRLDPVQRDKNLKMLEELLVRISDKWKDVSYTSSDKLVGFYDQ